MSLNNKNKLIEIAKVICRDLRNNSTKAERVLWEELRNKKFLSKKIYRQYPIFNDTTGKETFFVADFFCFADKLIIELDGQYHQYRLKEDKDRTTILNFFGLQVIRFTNDEIENNLEGVLNTLKKALTKI
jgi:very-short-patch-repair endonuclease